MALFTQYDRAHVCVFIYARACVCECVCAFACACGCACSYACDCVCVSLGECVGVSTGARLPELHSVRAPVCVLKLGDLLYLW